MKATRKKSIRQRRRKLSVRNRINKSATRARLFVHRTSKHIYAQVVEAETGRTVCGVGTTGKALSSELEGKTKSEKAVVIGREIARKATEAGVAEVVLDRGGSKYHGRVKALADAAREGGLKF